MGQDANIFGQFWNIKTLPFALQFPWKLLINKVATRDNLSKREVDVTSYVHVMRGRGEE